MRRVIFQMAKFKLRSIHVGSNEHWRAEEKMNRKKAAKPETARDRNENEERMKKKAMKKQMCSCFEFGNLV